MPIKSPPPSAALPPLWQQLQAAAAVLLGVRQGRSATAELAAVPAGLRAGVQSLVFHVLRHLGQADALRRQLARKAPAPAADALLCVSLALCCGEDPPYDAFVLCDQSVEAAKRNPNTKHQAGFINACLRRFLREARDLNALIAADEVAQWNHPRWWIARLQREYPKQWQQILRANNARPPMSLRVNASQGDVASYLARLTAQGVAATPIGADGLRLHVPSAVQTLPGFATGAVSVQDAAAQRAAPLLLSGLASAGRPLQVLDACAAPGGKTAHLLEYAAGVLRQTMDVTALEVDARRAERIHDTLQRIGMPARVVVADAAETDSWWDGKYFDAILLDAPCTASGIVRRHPDVRWLRKESDVAQLAAVQKRLLERLWPLLRGGGRLLYCTCSVFQAEGQNQVQTFLAHHNDAVLLDSPGHLIPGTTEIDSLLPDNVALDEDGFFFAVLEKRQA